MLTAARPPVRVESVSRSAATFVAISQAGAEMVTATILRCTGVLSCGQDGTGEMTIKVPQRCRLLTARRFTSARFPVRIEGEAVPAFAPEGGRAAHTQVLALVLQQLTHL